MAVTLKVIGNGHFQGAATNLSGYSATEDSTPIDPSDSSGGTGMIEFTVVEDPDPEGTILLLGDTIELEDGSNGRTRGIVSAVSGSNGESSVSAYSRLGMLNAEKNIPPFRGTLGDAFRYYLAQVEITEGVVVDDTIRDRAVVFSGFTGNLWEAMKQMCAAQQVEISLVSSNIVLRPLRSREVVSRHDVTQGWTVETGDSAQFVEVNYYNNEYKVNAPLYPKNGVWDEDLQIYQVDANETIEVEIPVDASVLSVRQPQPRLFVPRYFEGTESVYAIAGDDGLPIPPAQWVDGGGKVTVEIMEDSHTLKVTIKGPNEPEYAPYKLAMSSGPSDSYSSLRIVGTGVFYDKQVLTLPTGAPASKTAQVVGATVDNPFISTISEAYTAGMRAAAAWSGTKQRIEVTSTTVNRKGDKGGRKYPTFADFKAEYSGTTFAQWKVLWAGKTFEDFNNAMFERVQDDFENQAFGNVTGSRVKFRNQWYRIRSATIDQAQITYSAERDSTFGDFKKLWQGATFADFKTRYAGKTFADFGVISLWR